MKNKSYPIDYFMEAVVECKGNDLVVFSAADWVVIKELINKVNPEIGKTLNKAGITCFKFTIEES